MTSTRSASRPASRVTFDVRLAYRQRVIAASYADGAALHVESTLTHSTRCGRPIGEGWTGEFGPAIPDAVPTCAGCVRSLLADPTVTREGYAACCGTTFTGSDPVSMHVEYHNHAHRRGTRSHALGADGLPNVDAVTDAHALGLCMNAHPAYAVKHTTVKLPAGYAVLVPVPVTDANVLPYLAALLAPIGWDA